MTPPVDRHRVLAFELPNWKVGKRVVRPDGSDHGVIVEVTDQIKVRWDAGRTNYFKFHETGNVQLDN